MTRQKFNHSNLNSLSCLPPTSCRSGVCVRVTLHKYNAIHIPCNRLTIQYLNQKTAHLTINNRLLFRDAPPTCFGLYRSPSRRSLTKEYNYNKCYYSCACVKLNTKLSSKILLKFIKCRLITCPFTFLNNFI